MSALFTAIASLVVALSTDTFVAAEDFIRLNETLRTGIHCAFIYPMFDFDEDS